MGNCRGYLGEEVPYILKNYPNCEVIIFECSKKYIKKIKKRFRENNRVKIIEKAVSNEVSLKPDLYENYVTFDEIKNFLKQNGFEICLLRTDTNLTGNALFIGQ